LAAMSPPARDGRGPRQVTRTPTIASSERAQRMAMAWRRRGSARGQVKRRMSAP